MRFSPSANGKTLKSFHQGSHVDQGILELFPPLFSQLLCGEWIGGSRNDYEWRGEEGSLEQMVNSGARGQGAGGGGSEAWMDLMGDTAENQQAKCTRARRSV